MSRSISAGEKPAIIVENVSGDLSIVGWEGADILIKGDDDEIKLSQDGERVTLSSAGDLGLRVPKAASVFIKKVSGDSAVRGIQGQLEIKEAGADLSVRDVESVAIDTVRSDFSLRGARGSLSLKTCGSDVVVRGVGGNVAISSVGDDLVLRDVQGSVAANAGEDVVCYLDPKPGNAYTISAGDDLLIVMPQAVNATLNIQGDNIKVDWPGVELMGESTHRTVVLGDGSVAMNLTAGSDVRVTNRADAGDTAEEFGNFAGINMDFSGLGDLGDLISKRVTHATRHATGAAVEASSISERVQRATERAQRKVEQAARRAEQKAREVERHAHRAHRGVEIGRWSWDFSPKGVPQQPNDPVSDEERMSILKMLQEKKITAEEAEKLLAALEGGS